MKLLTHRQQSRAVPSNVVYEAGLRAKPNFHQENTTSHKTDWTDHGRPLDRIVSGINLIHTEQETERLFSQLRDIKSPTVVSFVNAHAVNMACKHPAFLENLLNSDFLLRDGSGMQMLLHMLHIPAGLNMNGTDLIPRLVSQLHNKSFAVYGTKSPWLEKAARKLSEQVHVIGTLDGFQLEQRYLAHARQYQPQVIILAMGMPKQERVAMLLKKELKHACLIINGGAILDFMAERFQRAPQWIQQLGVEWVYRLMQEPGRLYKRYVVGNIVFVARALWFRNQSARRFRPAAGKQG